MQITALVIAAATLFSAPATGPSDNPAFARAPWSDPSFFPTAVWLQDPKNAAKFKAAGINLYVGLWEGPTAAQIAALEKAGMPVICEQNAAALELLDKKIIVGWMHGDEPDNAQELPNKKGYGPPIDPARIVAAYRGMKAADPTRPVLLNLGQGVAWDQYYGRGVRSNHPEDYPKYIAGCDIASFDIYPASHPDKPIAGKLWYVAKGVDRLRASTATTRPAWACIETTCIGNPGHAPTPAQVRTEVWMAIAHGARGILYFSHQFKPTFIEAGLLADPATVKEVTAINAQLHELAPVLNGPELAGVTVTSSSADVPIDATSRAADGATYLFAVAMRDQSATASFRVPGISGATRAIVIGENRTIEGRDGVFSDAFAGYAVHLYKVIGMSGK